MRSATFIAVAAAVGLLVLGAVGVYAYDQGRKDRIAEGISVGGVDVGGLERDAAAHKLRTELLSSLRSPVVVRSAGHTFRLTARTSRIRADLEQMVADAVARGRSGTIVGRTLRGLVGGKVEADLDPRVTYSERAVERLVERVEDTVERRPRDARVDFAATDIRPVEGRDGLALDGDRLRERVEAALVRPAENQRIVSEKVRRIRPEVSTGELAKKYPTLIVVDRGGYTLRLFKKLKLVKSYPIAVGQVGLETPAGMYDIQNKAVNPTWNVPNSAWAGSMAGQIVPPGPSNPLKARWLGIYNGAGIHGTDQTGSIGTNASHGCIRMLIPDVIDLYDRVPVGAKVYIA